MVDFRGLKARAEALLSQMERGKEYTIGYVSQRLEKAASDHPQDAVIRAVAGVIDKMNRQTPNKLISQGEIDQLYGQLIGLDCSGTRFRDILGDLLMSQKPASATPNTKYADQHRDPIGDILSESDPALTKEFEPLFEVSKDRFDAKLALKAQDKVGMELYSLGVKKARLSVAGGNSQHVLIAADLDTNRGTVRVYIPADASGEKLPSTFVSDGTLVELTPSNLKTHLEQASLKRNQAPEIRIDGQVEMPKIPVPEPLKAMAAEVEESVLEATMGYPQIAVRLAKRMLLAELTAMGFRGSQVRISAPASDGFICEAVLNTPRGKVAIDVPIEMQNNQPLMPSVFAVGDKVEDFSESNLKAMLASEPEIAKVAVSRDSHYLGMGYYELKDAIIQSASQGDLKSCDEIMETIAEKFGADIYKTALMDYQKILSDIGSIKRQVESKCSRILKSSNSIYPICGHLMVPIHKVVQDEDGTCHLASTYHARKNQNAEGVLISTAKVLVGD